MDAAIDVRGLEVRYGDTVALSGLNLLVPTGSSLAVVGANGSGKSTLLGALAGLQKAVTGKVYVSGEGPALVQQATEIAEGLPITVRDAVKLARYPQLGLFRRFRDTDHAAVTAALERMHVADLADATLQDLSGGQRQRVLMAQGLAQTSTVLLLDEPMTGLDITSRSLVHEVITEETSLGRTVVMTTHSLADAAACDLVLLLNTTPVDCGPPATVLTESNLRRTFGERITQVGEGSVLLDHHGIQDSHDAAHAADHSIRK